MSQARTLQPASETAATGRIPLAVKLVYTAFLAVLVPYYWREYSPLNFLWFCDVALLLTLIAMWTERPLLIGMPSVGILLPQLLWLADFVGRVLTGRHVAPLSAYMFDGEIPLFVRGLSLFHGWLPLLLIYLLYRVGYDRRSLIAQTLVAWCVLAASALLVTDPGNPAGNVNKVFGPSDETVQTMMPQFAWVGLLMLIHPLAIYLPTHLLLRWWFPMAVRESAPEAAEQGE